PHLRDRAARESPSTRPFASLSWISANSHLLAAWSACRCYPCSPRKCYRSKTNLNRSNGDVPCPAPGSADGTVRTWQGAGVFFLLVMRWQGAVTVDFSFFLFLAVVCRQKNVVLSR